ncbi:hypothetical protein BKA70DRAFT_1344356, partial [Coprinopsis sp. MPI-PUGE-AT-0042]
DLTLSFDGPRVFSSCDYDARVQDPWFLVARHLDLDSPDAQRLKIHVPVGDRQADLHAFGFGMAFSILLCFVWVEVREAGRGRQEAGGSGLDPWKHSLSTFRRHLTTQHEASGRLNNDDFSLNANHYSFLATSVPASLVPAIPYLEPTVSIL